MNEPPMEIYLDTILQEGSSGQLCPVLGVMAMVMSNDHPLRCCAFYSIQDVLTQALCGLSDSDHRPAEVGTYLRGLDDDEVIHTRKSCLHSPT